MSILLQFYRYLIFLFQSKTLDQIKDPFVSDFYDNVLKDKENSPFFSKIEAQRTSLRKDQSSIDFNDFGSGTRSFSNQKKTISSIATNSLSLPYQCRVMSRMCTHFKPGCILELGTSLGISSSYLAAGNAAGEIWSLEGDPNCIRVANEVFKKLDLNNINTILGQFNETLEPVLSSINKIDLVFMDGHHNKEATMSYYDQIKIYCHNKTIIIVDDIYWSKGMQNAWKQLISSQDVTLSIDLFFCGVLFFRNDIDSVNRHYKLRPDRLLFHL